jgi:hypothetical protein
VTFADVRIEPAREVGTITGGGGICAPADAPEWVATLRNGVPAVGAVQPSAAPAARLLGEYVWGGVTVAQPGNFVAEHAPRLLFSASERPDCTVLFLLRKDVTPETLAAWFWQVLAWLGIGRDRVAFVADTPVVVERLTVFPQAEQLTGVLDDRPGPRDLDRTGLPSAEYLDALDQHASDRGIAPIENDLVYVSRAATVTPLAGESYLEVLLRGAGVCVLRPEEHDVVEQLRYFAGARRLVFAEGSALHFRQLLGRRPQTVTVLQRRPGRLVARGPLQPRVDSLDYVSVVSGLVLGPFDAATGVPVGYAALPYTDPARLVRAFRDLGIDLGGQWDDDEFAAAREQDLVNWARWVATISRNNALRYALNVVVSLIALGAPADVAQTVARVIDPDWSFDRLHALPPAVGRRSQHRTR